MDRIKMIEIIRKEYAEVVHALKEAETDYKADKRSKKKRETFQFIAAQEMELSDLCVKLEIELWNDNMDLIGCDYMKQFIRKIEENVMLYRDNKTGIAWIEDGRTGLGISVHSNINISGSVSGMKGLGYWGKSDRTVRSHGWIYNIDSFVCDEENELEMIVADECRCQGCLERRMRKLI